MPETPPTDPGITLTMLNGQKDRFLKSSIWRYGPLPEPGHPLYTVSANRLSPPKPPWIVAAAEPSTIKSGYPMMNSFICAGSMVINVAETEAELRKLLGW